MNIEWWRDLIIVVFGASATLLVLMCIVLMVVCYWRIKPIIKSIEKTAHTVENVTTCIQEEIVKPLSQLTAFIQGIRQMMSMMGKFSRKKEGKSNG